MVLVVSLIPSQKGIETQTFESPAFGTEGFMRSMDSAVQALIEAQLYERANSASKIIVAFLVRSGRSKINYHYIFIDWFIRSC